MDNADDSGNIQRKQELAGVFGRAASTYDRVGPRFFSHFGRRLVNLAGIAEGSRVLDIATGRGAVLVPAAEAAGPHGQVIGIDLAGEMVQGNRAEIERLKLHNVQVHQMDAEHLEFPDGSFDHVLCSFAIFFFPELDRALAEMTRVLKPNGRIAVTTWGAFDERWKGLDELVDRYLPDESETDATSNSQPAQRPVFNTPEGLEAILASAGFTDIKIIAEAEEFMYADEQQWWSTLWSHGMRAALEEIEEKLGKDGLERFQADALMIAEGMKQPGGIPQIFSVLFGLASRPNH